MGDAGGADITVELQAGNGSTVNFQTDAFNEACVKETGANLNYVIFDYDSGRGGYLYYQHGESGESEVGSAVITAPPLPAGPGFLCPRQRHRQLRAHPL